jgi:hypothetical protein
MLIVELLSDDGSQTFDLPPVFKVGGGGVVIANPETCDREPYTEFCGYFYGCMTQRNRMR